MKRLPVVDLLIIGSLLLATLLFFWKVVFLGEVFYFRDTFKLFYPMKKFMVTTLSRGELPLWNPYNFNGVPFLADNTTAVLYPVHILYVLFPFDIAFHYFILLHYVLGGVFVYLLMRGWNLSRYAATFAALAFMFNSYLVQMTGNIIYLAIIWIPLFLWALHRALGQGEVTAGILPGVVLAVQFLAGEPQSVYWSLLLGFFYLLSTKQWWQRDRLRGSWSLFPLLLFVVTGLTALGLAMIQFLPSLEMAMLSNRRGGIPYEFAVLWSYHPLRLLEFFIPFVFGNPLYPERYWGFSLQNFTDGGSAWTTGIYSGFLPIFFALLALCAGRQRRRILFLAIVAGMALFLAFGIYTPLYYFLYEYMPFFHLFRYPEKYMTLVTLIIPLLAGFGIDRVLGSVNTATKEEDSGQEKTLVSWIIRGIGAFSLLLLIGYGLLIWKSEGVEAVQQAIQGYQNSHLNPQVILTQIRAHVLFACGISVGSGATFLLWQRKCISGRSVKILLLAILILDLFIVSSQVNYTTFPELHAPLSPDTDILKFLQPQEEMPFRVHRDKLFFYDQRDDNSPLALYERRKLWEKYTLVENIGMNYGIQYMHGYAGYHLARYFDLQQHHLFPYLLNLFNVRYFLVHHRSKAFADPHRYRTVALAPWNGLRVVENLQVFPRAFWVPQAIVLHNKEAILQRLADPQFHPREEVILENDVTGGREKSESGGEAQVTILSYAPQRVSVQVQSSARGFVVLGDTYYPGWKAFIDDRPTRLFRADYILRAVEVAGGVHRIDFVYDPWTFKVGALISGLTCLVIGGVFLNRKLG